MPIPVTCSCGQKLSVPDDMAGKIVKCPACHQVLHMRGTDKETAARAGLGSANVAGRRPRARDTNGPDEHDLDSRSSSPMLALLVGLILGAVTVGLCFGAGIGASLYGLESYWPDKHLDADKSPDDNAAETDTKPAPEKKTSKAKVSPPAKNLFPAKIIIGKWQGDPDSMRKKTAELFAKMEMFNMLVDMNAAKAYEFRPDGSVTLGLDSKALGIDSVTRNGKWKALDTKGAALKIEIIQVDPPQAPETHLITVLDNDHFKMVQEGKTALGSLEIAEYFKRVQDGGAGEKKSSVPDKSNPPGKKEAADNSGPGKGVVPPEKAFIGIWKLDPEAMVKNAPADVKDTARDLAKLMGPVQYEFRPDGGMTMGFDRKMKWKLLDSKPGKLKVEISREDPESAPEIHEITVLDSNHLRMVEVENKVFGTSRVAFYLQRVK